jgi:hypothetical protein
MRSKDFIAFIAIAKAAVLPCGEGGQGGEVSHLSEGARAFSKGKSPVEDDPDEEVQHDESHNESKGVKVWIHRNTATSIDWLAA